MTAINTAIIHRQRKRFVANTLTLAATYADVLWDISDVDGLVLAAASKTTAWLDKGDAAKVVIDGTWVTGTGSPLTIVCYGTNDVNGVVLVALPYIPADTDGSVTAYQQEVAFPKASWGNASTCYVGGTVLCEGWQYIKVQAKDANASGTFAAGAKVSVPRRV